MANEKSNRVVLQFIIDKVALANVKQELTSVRSQMQQFAADAKKSDIATVAAGKSIRDSFGSQASSRIAAFQGQMANAVTSTKGLTAALNETEQASGFLGKLQSVQSRAAVLGRELKALPAVQIGSTGLSTDAVGKLTQVFGKLPPAALGAGVALAAVVVALKLAADAATAQAEAQKRSNEVQEEITRAVITSTKAELEAKLEAVRIEKAVQLSLFNQRIEKLNELEKREEGVNQLFGRNIVAGAESLGLYAGDIKQQREDVMATSKELIKASELEQAYTDAIDQNRTAANDAKEAEKQLAEERQKATERSIQSILSESKSEQDAAKLTTEQNKQKQADIENQMALLAQEIQLRQASGDASKENNDKLDELALRYADLSQQTAYLAGAGLDLAKANDAAAEAEKKRADSINAVKKFNEDLVKIDENNLQAKAAIEQRYGDQLVNIAERAADAAANALEKLVAKRDSLALDFARAGEDAQRDAQRDALDAQIKYQQQEAKDARDHARNLADIRRRAQEQETELALNRDFAGLFQLRRDTNSQLDEENRKYADQRADRIEAIQQEIDDNRRKYEQDAEDRQIKYQRELADAQAQFLRELAANDVNQRKATAQATAARDRDLRIQQEKYVAEISQRQAAIRAELQTIQAGNAAKLALEQSYYQQSLSILKGAIGSVTGAFGGGRSGGGGGGGGNGGRAFGGSVAAGQAVKVNELAGQRERFNGQLLPSGQGLFLPFTSGNVSPNGGGGAVVNITNNITGGGNPEAIAQAVDSRIERTLTRIFKPARGAA